MTSDSSTIEYCARCGSTDSAVAGIGCALCGCSEPRASTSRAHDAPLPRFVFPRGRLLRAARSILARPTPLTDESLAREPAMVALCDAVSAAWSEPHRRYHTLQHLAECLRALDDPAVEGGAAREGELELALFFHDLIYDTTRSDNEERSAERAAELLGALEGASSEAIGRVRAMILATRHHVAESADEQLLLDLDLSILGADEARFAEYEAQIREEFFWVPDEAYAAGRARVLRGFAERPRIFHREALFERLESRARANLRRALAGCA